MHHTSQLLLAGVHKVVMIATLLSMQYWGGGVMISDQLTANFKFQIALHYATTICN